MKNFDEYNIQLENNHLIFYKSKSLTLICMYISREIAKTERWTREEVEGEGQSTPSGRSSSDINWENGSSEFQEQPYSFLPRRVHF